MVPAEAAAPRSSPALMHTRKMIRDITTNRQNIGLVGLMGGSMNQNSTNTTAAAITAPIIRDFSMEPPSSFFCLFSCVFIRTLSFSY